MPEAKRRDAVAAPAAPPHERCRAAGAHNYGSLESVRPARRRAGGCIGSAIAPLWPEQRGTLFTRCRASCRRAARPDRARHAKTRALRTLAASQTPARVRPSFIAFCCPAPPGSRHVIVTRMGRDAQRLGDAIRGLERGHAKRGTPWNNIAKIGLLANPPLGTPTTAQAPTGTRETLFSPTEFCPIYLGCTTQMHRI